MGFNGICTGIKQWIYSAIPHPALGLQSSCCPKAAFCGPDPSYLAGLDPTSSSQQFQCASASPLLAFPKISWFWKFPWQKAEQNCKVLKNSHPPLPTTATPPPTPAKKTQPTHHHQKPPKQTNKTNWGRGNKTDPVSKHGLNVLAITAWQCSCRVSCLLTSWIPCTSYSSQRKIKVTSRVDMYVLWRGQGQSPLWGFKNRCAAKGTKRWTKSFFPPHAASVDTQCW